MSERSAGKAIAVLVGLLAFPLAIYVLWRIERDQADAVLENIQRDVRLAQRRGNSL